MIPSRPGWLYRRTVAREGSCRAYNSHRRNRRSELMSSTPRRLAPLVAFALCAAFCAATVSAEVTRVEIRTRADVLAGRAFGDVGAYETLAGTIYFAGDPANPHNR